MKTKLNVGFITTVSGRWPRDLPNERLASYGTWLTETFPQFNLIQFESIVDSTERIEAAVDTLRREGADIVIMLYGAFTGDDVSVTVAESLGVPLILWAPHEPELFGNRLLANAMVALAMNGASLRRLGHRSYPLYGNLDTAVVYDRLNGLLTAYSTAKAMRHTMLGLFGYRPTAFYNSTFDEGLIRRTFGVRMEETDLKMVFDAMAALPEAEVAADRARVREEFHLLDTLPDEHYENHSRLYLALKRLTAEQGYDFSAIKCWPEMGTLRTTPCAVLGRLADEGIHIACESDVDATLSMIAQTYITGKPNFITDMIDLNEEENYLTFWHCGNAAPSLHAPGGGCQMGNHPLAGQGTAFYTPLKEGPVTISRFCNIDGAYKLFLLRGTAIPTTLYTPGCMINVRVSIPVKDLLYSMIEQGVPHHYSIVWDDVGYQMKQLAAVLGVEPLFY